jgi:hypothetical protein
MSRGSKNKTWLILEINRQNVTIKAFFSLGRCKQHVLKHAFNGKERWDELSNSLAIHKRERALENLQRLGCLKQIKDCQSCNSVHETDCTKELWPFINNYEKIIGTTLLESSKIPRYLQGTTAGGQSSIYFLCDRGVLAIANLRGQCYNVSTAFRAYPINEADPGRGYLDYAKFSVQQRVKYRSLKVIYMAGENNWGFDDKGNSLSISTKARLARKSDGKVTVGQLLSEEARTNLQILKQKLQDEAAKQNEDEPKSPRKRKRKRERTSQPE